MAKQHKHHKQQQRRRPEHVYPLAHALSLPWMYAARPTLCTGVASLWQGLMDILSPQFLEMPQAYFRANDVAALTADMRAVLNDARQAHQQLLLNYPQLTKN